MFRIINIRNTSDLNSFPSKSSVSVENPLKIFLPCPSVSLLSCSMIHLI